MNEKSLSFVDCLFDRAADLEKRGFLAAACREWRRLLHIRPLRRKMVGRAAGRLGKLELQRGQFARARRHLSLAVARMPQNAEWRILLAQCNHHAPRDDSPSHRVITRSVMSTQVVANVAGRSRHLSELEEAQRKLRQARFRHGRDPRFQQLWNDHQFQLLWARQQAALRGSAQEIPVINFRGRHGPALQVPRAAGN